jgi:centromere/kinetochore protein ZW10
MVSEDIQARIGPAIVDYSENGAFPEEETLAAASVGDSVLPAALKALNDAKLDLEVSCFSHFLYLSA